MLQTEGGREGGRGTAAGESGNEGALFLPSFLPRLLGCERGAMQTKAPWCFINVPSITQEIPQLPASPPAASPPRWPGGKEGEGIYFQSNWRARKREGDRLTHMHLPSALLSACLPACLPAFLPRSPIALLPPPQHEKHAMSIGLHRVRRRGRARDQAMVRATSGHDIINSDNGSRWQAIMKWGIANPVDPSSTAHSPLLCARAGVRLNCATASNTRRRRKEEGARE